MASCEPGKPGPHYWVIQPADYEMYGPKSPGECQLCGDTRNFSNVVDYESGKQLSINIKADDQEAPAGRGTRDA